MIKINLICFDQFLKYFSLNKTKIYYFEKFCHQIKFDLYRSRRPVAINQLFLKSIKDSEMISALMTDIKPPSKQFSEKGTFPYQFGIYDSLPYNGSH